ncbi:MAG: hypothetical protein ACKOW8_04995, partial [Flavobacteriales bacterium]
MSDSITTVSFHINRFAFTVLMMVMLPVWVSAQCIVNAGSDITICSGESVTLGGNPVMNSPPANATYVWTADVG